MLRCYLPFVPQTFVLLAFDRVSDLSLSTGSRWECLEFSSIGHLVSCQLRLHCWVSTLQQLGGHSMRVCEMEARMLHVAACCKM